jgi:hypothetical protein
VQGPLVSAGTWSFGCEATVRYLARCHSLQCCISPCEKGKQWQQSLGLLVMMQQSGLVHEIITGTVAISACGKVEQWQKALGPWQLCSSLAGARYHHLQRCLTACGKGEQWQQVLGLGCDASVWSCARGHHLHVAVSTCKRGEQWQLAFGLLAVMQQSRRLPDVVTYNAAIGACKKG